MATEASELAQKQLELSIAKYAFIDDNPDEVCLILSQEKYYASLQAVTTDELKRMGWHQNSKTQRHWRY